MSAQIIPFSSTEAPKQPARPPRRTRAEREAEREATRVRELQERRDELKQEIALDPTFRAWHSSLDRLSVQMELPYIHIRDAKEMFERLFKNGAMRLQY